MTPSTTNTAALDKGPWHVGKDARDVFSADFTADVALRISGDFRDDEHKRQYAEWLVAALNFATLTQQQGGEQEGDGWDERGGAIWLDREQWGIVIDALIDHRAIATKRKDVNSASTSDVRADMCATLIGLIGDAASAPHALRTKQPAASEGDGLLEMLRECYEWLFESKADGPQVSEGAIERGYYTPEFRDMHDRLRAAIDNTSKQAAGEAVDDAMVDRACDAYDAVAFELANRTAIREALIAALQAGAP